MKYLKNFNTLLEYEDALILDVPNVSYIVETEGIRYSEEPKIGSKYILYTSGDGKVVAPNNTNVFGASLLSNNYDDFGLLSFDDSVTTIGTGAFQNRYSLTSITIPNSVTSIGHSAFGDCHSLTSVTIPNSVRYIGNYTFKECTKLESVTIGNNVENIYLDAFLNCSGLTRTNYMGDITNWLNIDFSTKTSNPMYYSRNLYINNVEITDLVIPDSITNFSSYSFINCDSLKSVDIPNSIQSLSTDCFSGCSSLTSISWDIPYLSDPSLPEDAIFLSINPQIESFTFGNDTRHIPSYLCQNMNKLTSIIIPENVTSIGSYAFANCTNLLSINIPNNVSYIGPYAFKECSLLPVENDLCYAGNYLVCASDKNKPSYLIKEGTKWIGESAFSYCNSFTSIDIPESVKYIGNMAFQGCNKLNNITLGDNISYIGNYAFDANTLSDNGVVSWEHDIAYLDDYAISHRNPTIEKLIRENVKGIVGSILYYATLSNPDLVLNNANFLGKDCFSYSNLRSISLNNIKILDLYCLARCSLLESVVLGNTIELIEDYAFLDTPLLETLDLSDKNNLKKIGSFAFYNSGIKSITIPENLEEIGQNAIGPNTESVVWNAIDCKGGHYPISVYGRPFTITFGEKVVSIPEGLCRNNGTQSEYILPNSVKYIRRQAFADNTILKKITLSNNLEYIEDSAFSNTGLTSITLPKSIKYLGSLAILGSGLTSVIYEGTTAEWEAIKKADNCIVSQHVHYIQCSDGQVSL